MFTCAGWCVLDCAENDLETASETYEKINAIAREIQTRWSHAFSRMTVHWSNGQCFLMVCHSQNHGAAMHPVIESLTRFITEAAPRSYGVIHSLDDEIPGEPAFQVVKIVGPSLMHDVDRALAEVDYME
jgi:hypothetical protein